jgi:hypothetical protein
VPQVESRDNFIPTDHERRVLLELLQSPQESLESIANELKITLAALTVYLATDDAASLFAQSDLANARRARTAAAAQLEQCVGALSLMISGWVSDVTHNLRRETPKSRREQDREQESTRRAATLLYRIANFTPKTLTLAASTLPPAPPLPAQREVGGEVPESARAVRGLDASIAPPTPENPPLPNTNPTRKRGATDAPIALPDLESPQLPSPSASTSPERERVGLSTPHPISRPISSPLSRPCSRSVSTAHTSPTPITISAHKPIPAPARSDCPFDIAPATSDMPSTSTAATISRAPP